MGCPFAPVPFAPVTLTGGAWVSGLEWATGCSPAACVTPPRIDPTAIAMSALRCISASYVLAWERNEVKGVKWSRRQRPTGRSPRSRALVALFGDLGVLVRVRSPLFLYDKPLDQGEKAVIEIRIRDGLAFDDTQDLGGARRHGDGRRTDSRARGLLHFLQFALLALGGGEYDACSVPIVGAGRLQTQRHVDFI